MVLPGAEVVLAQAGHVEHRLVGAVEPGQQPGLFFALLQDAGDRHHVAPGLLLALHVKIVVGINPDAFQVAAQLDALEAPGIFHREHFLVIYPHPGPADFLHRLQRFGGDLVGVLEMGHHCDLPARRIVVLAQDRHQVFGPAHRQHHGGAGAEADAVDLRLGGEGLEDLLQLGVLHDQRIAAGDQHISHAGMLVEPGQGLRNQLPAGHCLRVQAALNLPVTLAVDADLSAGVEGFEDGDIRITAGDQLHR